MFHLDETGNPCPMGDACRVHYPHPEDWVGCPEKVVNCAQLETELNVLGIAGVHFHINGMAATGIFTGCYPWDNTETPGTFKHISIKDTDKVRVRAVVAAHIPG